MRRLGLPAALLLSVTWTAGCATASPGDSATAAPAESAGGATELPRALQGSLRQQEITVELRVRGLQLRLTPLDPEITRLTAPDTRRRLESLRRSGGGAAFLVSIFTEEPGGVDFEPRSLLLENRGRVFRPRSIRPLTPGWGERLQQQRTEQAVYTFDAEVDLEMPLVVEMTGIRSAAWASILPRLDAERARIRARGGQSSSSNFRILR